MKRAYWEKMAADYSEEIFDVLHHDKKGLIRAIIAHNAGKNKTVIDIGCAIGKWLPVLSPKFKKVIALDISANNLKIAREKHASLTNIDYVRADMSGRRTPPPACDFGICINAIMTPDRKARDRFFDSLSPCIKKGGEIVITVPSLESHLLTQTLQQRYKIDSRYFKKEKNGKEALRKWLNILQGNAEIDHVPHKHYLREELEHLLREYGFRIVGIEKLEYDWSTEFHQVPVFLQQPGPWDWMVHARKR